MALLPPPMGGAISVSMHPTRAWAGSPDKPASRVEGLPRVGLAGRERPPEPVASPRMGVEAVALGVRAGWPATALMAARLPRTVAVARINVRQARVVFPLLPQVPVHASAQPAASNATATVYPHPALVRRPSTRRPARA